MTVYKFLKLTHSGGIADEGLVPVEVFSGSLATIQRIIYLFAMECKGYSSTERATPPEKLREEFKLLFSGSNTCCVQATIGIGNESNGLFISTDIDEVLERFNRLGKAFTSGSLEDIQIALPDTFYRSKIFHEIEKLDYRDCGINVNLHDASDKHLIMDTTSVPFKMIKEETARKTKPDEDNISGRLIHIMFEEHRFLIYHKPSGKKVYCAYQDEDEDELLRNPRKLVQVTGDIVLDSRGKPKEVVNVSGIETVNVKTILVDEVSFNDKNLTARDGSVSVSVAFDENNQVYIAENEDIGLDVIAITRESLEDEVYGEIASLWSTYTPLVDDELTKEALRMRNSLQDLFFLSE